MRSFLHTKPSEDSYIVHSSPSITIFSTGLGDLILQLYRPDDPDDENAEATQ
jgi:hypothetical protein